MMDSPVTSVSCSHLHCHEVADQHCNSQQLMLGGEEEDHTSQHWPVELMVMVHSDQSVTVLNRWVWLGAWLILAYLYLRDTYQVLYSGALNDTALDTYQPGELLLATPTSKLHPTLAAKRMRSSDQESTAGSLSLSPNSSCVAISTAAAGGILVYALSPIILGQTSELIMVVVVW